MKPVTPEEKKRKEKKREKLSWKLSICFPLLQSFISCHSSSHSCCISSSYLSLAYAFSLEDAMNGMKKTTTKSIWVSATNDGSGLWFNGIKFQTIFKERLKQEMLSCDLFSPFQGVNRSDFGRDNITHSMCLPTFDWVQQLDFHSLPGVEPSSSFFSWYFAS